MLGIDEYVQRLWADNPATPDAGPEPSDALGQRQLVIVAPTPIAASDASADTAVVARTVAGETAAGAGAAQSGDGEQPVAVATEAVLAGDEAAATGATHALHVAGPADPPNKITLPLNEWRVSRVDPDPEFIDRKGVLG